MAFFKKQWNVFIRYVVGWSSRNMRALREDSWKPKKSSKGVKVKNGAQMKILAERCFHTFSLENLVGHEHLLSLPRKPLVS